MDIFTHTIRQLITSFLYSISPLFESASMQQRSHQLIINNFQDVRVSEWIGNGLEGLAGVVRLVRGVETRGLIAWEAYLTWRRYEQGECMFDKLSACFCPWYTHKIDWDDSRAEFGMFLSLVPALQQHRPLRWAHRHPRPPPQAEVPRGHHPHPFWTNWIMERVLWTIGYGSLTGWE